jgi:hypothetical protein
MSRALNPNFEADLEALEALSEATIPEIGSYDDIASFLDEHNVLDVLGGAILRNSTYPVGEDIVAIVEVQPLVNRENGHPGYYFKAEANPQTVYVTSGRVTPGRIGDFHYGLDMQLEDLTSTRPHIDAERGYYFANDGIHIHLNPALSDAPAGDDLVPRLIKDAAFDLYDVIRQQADDSR